MDTRILFLLLVWYIISVTGVQISEILRTPQFMLISQFKCQTVFEANIQHQRCPRGLIVPLRSSTCGIAVRAHLVRDPLSLHPPKVLFLGADLSGRAVGFLEDIQIPTHHNGSETAINTRTIDFGYRAVLYLDRLLYHDVSGSVYDTDSQQLYLITRGSHCFVFFLKNIFFHDHDNRLSFDLLYDFPLHINNGARYDWTSDPYTSEAYYTTRQGDITMLHAVKLSGLLAVFREGARGKTVHTHTGDEKRSHFRVSGGAMFSYSQHEESDIAYIRALHRKEEGGIFCASKWSAGRRSQLPAAIPIIVVRDYDFCLLRDNISASETACAAEKHDWLVQQGMVKDESGLDVTILLLLIAVIILGLLVVLLVVCLCWMKRNLDESFVEELHQPMPYYPNQPGQYPDMDVSVDKWNY